MEKTSWRGYDQPADRNRVIAWHSAYNTFNNLVHGVSLQ